MTSSHKFNDLELSIAKVVAMAISVFSDMTEADKDHVLSLAEIAAAPLSRGINQEAKDKAIDEIARIMKIRTSIRDSA